MIDEEQSNKSILSGTKSAIWEEDWSLRSAGRVDERTANWPAGGFSIEVGKFNNTDPFHYEDSLDAVNPCGLAIELQSQLPMSGSSSLTVVP